MAHKKKKYDDWDNSRKAFRWRLKHNILTNTDKQRLEKHSEVKHQSKINALIQSGEVRTKIKRGGNMVNVRKH